MFILKIRFFINRQRETSVLELYLSFVGLRGSPLNMSYSFKPGPAGFEHQQRRVRDLN